MKKFSCVIVDDDPLMLAVISDMVEGIQELELVGAYENSVSATTGITKTKPALLLLDLMMPGLDGLDVLDVMDVKPNVIVISGMANMEEMVLRHPQVVEFLHKPVTEETLKLAVRNFVKSQTGR